MAPGDLRTFLAAHPGLPLAQVLAEARDSVNTALVGDDFYADYNRAIAAAQAAQNNGGVPGMVATPEQQVQDAFGGENLANVVARINDMAPGDLRTFLAAHPG